MNFVQETVRRLDGWIQKNGYRGYDPYDVQGTPVVLNVIKSKSIVHIFRRPLLAFVTLFPRASRVFFGVKKAINAKAMALFARGYFNLYRSLKEKKYLGKAVACLNWLEENHCRGYSGYCWGYPFDWWSGGGILFPKGTPSGVVSSIAGHAFLDGFDVLGEEKYLKVAKGVCSFIVNDLSKALVNDKICFSYTPLDDYQVHNANLWCASLLGRVTFHTKNHLFEKLATNAIKFTVGDQREDGAWYYWDIKYAKQKGIKNESTIDNYHTGFLIECLIDCGKYLSSVDVKENVKKAAEFYVNNFVEKGEIAKLHPRKSYPVSVHGCAQTIITLTKLSEINHQYLDVGKKVALWTIRNMQDEDGFFYYRIYRWRADRMPYIRWGEAWMLKALSDILLQASNGAKRV